MSRFVRLIDAYKDRTGGPSDSSIARAIGVKPQTISSWRQRGIRELPNVSAMQEFARLAGIDYEAVVLRAALQDVGYLPEDGDEGEQAPAKTS